MADADLDRTLLPIQQTKAPITEGTLKPQMLPPMGDAGTFDRVVAARRLADAGKTKPPPPPTKSGIAYGATLTWIASRLYAIRAAFVTASGASDKDPNSANDARMAAPGMAAELPQLADELRQTGTDIQRSNLTDTSWKQSALPSLMHECAEIGMSIKAAKDAKLIGDLDAQVIKVAFDTFLATAGITETITPEVRTTFDAHALDTAIGANLAMATEDVHGFSDDATTRRAQRVKAYASVVELRELIKARGVGSSHAYGKAIQALATTIEKAKTKHDDLGELFIQVGVVKAQLK